MDFGVERKKRLPSVLTSDVHNEAELIFQILEHKEKKCISYLDCLTLMRGIGMNPVPYEMEELHESMKEPIEKLEAIRREEEKRKEKERKEKEKKDPKKEQKEKEQKEKEEAEGKGPKKKVLTEPAEEVKNIDWNIFITAVEPVFKDNRVEEEEIVAAFKVFEPTKETMSRSDLIRILTQNGETVLSPAEVKQLMEAFPNEEINFREFAQRIQGTYVPPPQPTKEEIAAQKEKERLAAEAAKGDDLDALLS